jgi:hypothetical protein
VGALACAALAALPAVSLLDEARTGLSGGALVVMRINASLVIGALLYAGLLRGFAAARTLPGWQGRATAGLFVACAVAIAAAVPMLDPGGEVSLDRVSTAAPPPEGNVTPERTTTTESTPITAISDDNGTTGLPPSTDFSRGGSLTGPGSSGQQPSGPASTVGTQPTQPTQGTQGTTTVPRAPSTTQTTRPPTTTTQPPAPAVRPLRMLSVGDSNAGEWGKGMDRWGEAAQHRMDVDLMGGPGCALYAPGYAELRPGWNYYQSDGCKALIDIAISEGRKLQPDVVVLSIGGMQLSDWKQTPSSPPTSIGDPLYDVGYTNALSSAVRRLVQELDVPVLVATIPVPKWNPANAPGSGPLTTNNPTRTRRLNEINRNVVSQIPGARIAPFAEAVDLSDGSVDPRLHPDGLHIDPAQVPAVMDAGLANQLRDLYRSIAAAQPALQRPGNTIWWP